MESVTTQVVYVRSDHSMDKNSYKSGYDVDIWQVVRKRWMVPGVLLAMALAVLAPHFGAPGGNYMHAHVVITRTHCTHSTMFSNLKSNGFRPGVEVINFLIIKGWLHTEYVSYVPLSYIYFAAGRARAHAGRTRLYALTTLHAQVVALAVCAVTVSALTVALDRRVIEGAMLASVSRPCAWLPLSLSNDGVTPALAAFNYASSFVLSPLAHLVLCGRVPVPLLRRVLTTAVSACIPFTLGTLSQKDGIDSRGSKISALVILYTECCQLLREAEGSLYITDVMATLFLVISWLTTVATSSHLYVKCGVLTVNEAQALLLVSTPKSIHIEWMSATLCSASGLARLPAVFIAPAQALLLAAVTSDHVGDDVDDGDDELPR